ncbi:hypothetical protein HNP84_009348 [Thermocatellispora tengchongensis]|uniref:Carboxypeptidase regulatory-like domain-containing protein n=1 Tax=Thermocatellispora tengchongensis TaxID=1073253 RepID=A0A840PDU5_9ACTN|nr:carboxypeptidase-like regulatory domain-containing protein [Thermocatellispora tengchongensis]MBB5139584.1 hypothetical protein [Thermocatellispora tengchongensis]
MRRLLITGLLVLSLSGCGIVTLQVGDGQEGAVNAGRTGEAGQGDGGARLGEVEPGVLKGRVVDQAGQPIAGATIFADNQLLYNSNAIGTTDADGYYRVETPGSFTFHASGQVKRQLDGQEYVLDLEPDSDEPFAGPTGAIRNFTWKLAGPKANGQGHHGGSVLFYFGLDGANSNVFLEDEKVTLTLAPEGPLIDGSAGETLSVQAQRTPDGSGVQGVPIGRYRITASYEGSPLRIRLRNTGEYASEVVAGFSGVVTGVYQIELEVTP